MYLSSTSATGQPARQPVSVFYVELVTTYLVASSHPVLFRGHARLFFFFLYFITIGIGPRPRLYPYTLPPRLYQTSSNLLGTRGNLFELRVTRGRGFKLCVCLPPCQKRGTGRFSRPRAKIKIKYKYKKNLILLFGFWIFTKM